MNKDQAERHDFWISPKKSRICSTLSLFSFPLIKKRDKKIDRAEHFRDILGLIWLLTTTLVILFPFSLPPPKKGGKKKRIMDSKNRDQKLCLFSARSWAFAYCLNTLRYSLNNSFICYILALFHHAQIFNIYVIFLLFSTMPKCLTYMLTSQHRILMNHLLLIHNITLIDLDYTRFFYYYR